MPESTARPGGQLLTCIIVFDVEPKNQQRAIEIWNRGTDEVIRHQPGFVSAKIHRSLDGTKIVTYAQWESEEAFTAMLLDMEADAHLKKLREFGRPVPIVCEVVSVHAAPS